MDTKVKTYVGFAIKARKAVFGLDNITDFRKRMYLILMDESLSPNNAKKLIRHAEEKNIPLVNFCIENILPEKNCKAIGIIDQNLASAIFKELKESL